MGSHTNKDGQFQSDKYPTCPPGKVPLSVKDPLAQDLLLEYARRRRHVDEELSRDVEDAVERAIANEPLEWTLCRLHGQVTRTGSCDSCVGDRNLIQVVAKNDVIDVAHDVSISSEKHGWEAGKSDAMDLLKVLRAKHPLHSSKWEAYQQALSLLGDLKAGGT
jgi:hypothetical protein